MSNRSGRTAIATSAAEFQAAFDMSRLPTANELLERLRAIYEEQAGESLSDEKLAGRLPISLSTFNRWKKGDTKQFRDIVKMLGEAGWLKSDDARTKRPLTEDERARARRAHAELEGLLQSFQEGAGE